MATNRTAMPQFLCAFGVLLAVVSPGCRMRPARMRVALIPPQNDAAIADNARAIGDRLGLQIDSLDPESMVGGKLRPDRYCVAVYTGGYLFKVRRPGDATEALLRYVKDGGFLVVCGGVWPFYQPFDYAGSGTYTPSTERPARVPKFDDPWLEKQMADIRRSNTLQFNTALGLNISGPGTTGFEKPSEPVTFHTEPGQKIFRNLPKTLPFPSSGDRRFRPVSGKGLPAGATFTPIMRLKGKSGTDYGPAAALIKQENGGQVLYVWAPIVRERGEAILRDAVLLATARPSAAMSDDAKLLMERVKVLKEGVRSCRERIRTVVAPRISPHYFLRQCDGAEAALIDANDTVRIGNPKLARKRIDQIERDIAILERRVRAVSQGIKAK